MAYSSGSTVIGDDVADAFWDSYFSGVLPVGSAYVNGVLYGGGTTNFSAANTIGFTTYYWFLNDSNFPGTQSQPGSTTEPSRNLTDITGDITAAGIFSAIKNEVQRFTTYNSSVKWYVTRNWQTYTTVPGSGSSYGGIDGPEGRPKNADVQDHILYQRAHEQVKERWMTTSQFSFTDPVNNIVADVDDISTSEYNALFQSFADAYSSAVSSASLSTTVVSSYTQCHNSCHTSCHGSRTRR